MTAAARRRGLPVADARTVRRFVVTLARERRGPLLRVTLWFALATLAGLAIPALLGELVDRLAAGARVDIGLIMAGFALFLAVQAVLTRVARLAAAELGERTLSDVRTRFVERVLRVPVTAVEEAGRGDLLSRMSRDVDALSTAVRTGAPAILIAGVSVLLTVVVIAVVSPLASSEVPDASCDTPSASDWAPVLSSVAPVPSWAAPLES